LLSLLMLLLLLMMKMGVMVVVTADWRLPFSVKPALVITACGWWLEEPCLAAPQLQHKHAVVIVVCR
jgi:hypothetical protein